MLVAVMVALAGFCHSTVNAQVTVRASIDSTRILLGDQIRLLLEIDKPKDLEVLFPKIKDTLSSHIEVVSRTKIDTVKLDSKVREKLVQTYYITSFDSGMHHIPSFFFKLKDGNTLDSAATLALAFQVFPMKIDTTKGPTDIKQPYAAPVTLKEVTPYILGIILLAAILFFIFYYIKWKKKNVPIFVRPEKPVDPAHVVALRELDRIKNQKLWQQDKTKQYYSEVADTIRIYIEKRFDIPAMEFTSAETLGTFRQNNNWVDISNLDQLQHILSLADLVKFAKYNPLPDDNNLTLSNAYQFVEQTKVDEPKTTESHSESNVSTNDSTIKTQ
jgi:hypothetical protein